MAKSKKQQLLVQGAIYSDVMLQTCLDPRISRPRVQPDPESGFPADIRVEFPRDLRAEYPLGTRFRATVLVCQKHWSATGLPKGQPYLRATDIFVRIAKPVPKSKSKRAYVNRWEQVV